MRINITSRNDLLAVGVLLLLWLLFFWRLFTPIASDQASITNGDFSGQFVTFAAYQYQRFAVGEIPLWNPYNNGGLPFIGDTQAAVFYPPRLLTIALASLSGGWTYHALELEMTFHVLLYSLLMYALLRRLTSGSPVSQWASLIAAIIAAYGGYLSGYPPLQLAVMEAGIWLPLALLGIVEATRPERLNTLWLIVTGFALGLSWLAGHPQTSWFLTYLLVAYFAFRCYNRYTLWAFISGTALFGLLSFGLAAVQLLPGVEYLAHTARVDLGYDAKGNGFPFRDFIQFIFPSLLSLFSPLYIGITGLALACIGIWRGTTERLFWAAVALVALGLSLGANSALFPALYNLLPGLRFFRGQERAAYLVSSSLAILAGLGAAQLLSSQMIDQRPRVRQALTGLLIIIGAVSILVFSQWLLNPAEMETSLNGVIFALVISGLLLILADRLTQPVPSSLYLFLLIGLIVFELFTVSMDADSNYDPVPPTEQLAFTTPELISTVQVDTDGIYRVDGFRGLHDNFGSLYSIMDMRGISPLFLDSLFRLIEPEKINPLAWELFAVRYVYSDWEQLPVASTIIARGEDRYGPVNLHRLENPRPFAHFTTQTAVVDSDEFARALLHDPDFNPRTTIILNTPFPETQPDSAAAEVVTLRPEFIEIAVRTDQNSILSLSHPHYPGWYAHIDGQPAELLRAYGGLSALAIPAGEHNVELRYDPLSYRIGLLLSLFTSVSTGILGAGIGIKRLRTHASS